MKQFKIENENNNKYVIDDHLKYVIENIKTSN